MRGWRQTLMPAWPASRPRAGRCSERVTRTVSLNQAPSSPQGGSVIIIPILQMSPVKLREEKSLAPGHVAQQWWSQDPVTLRQPCPPPTKGCVNTHRAGCESVTLSRIDLHALH